MKNKLTTLFRYMSKREADALLTGNRIFNTTDHHGEHNAYSNAVGFCFGRCTDAEDAARQARRLIGIVSLDHLIVGRVAQDILYTFDKAVGRYTDYDAVDKAGGIEMFGLGEAPQREYEESCRTAYFLDIFEDYTLYKVVGYSDGRAILHELVTTKED